MGKLNSWLFGSTPTVQDFIYGNADAGFAPEEQEGGFIEVTDLEDTWN